MPTTITRVIKVRNLDERSSYQLKYLDGIIKTCGGQVKLNSEVQGCAMLNIQGCNHCDC